MALHDERYAAPSTSNSPSDGSRSGPTDGPPFGVWIIAILGGLVSVFAFLPILAIMGSDGVGFLVGLVLFVLNAAQLYVLVGLVRLESWAWTWALVLFGISAVIDLVTAQLLSLIVTVVIIAYLVSKVDYYD